MVKNVQNPIRRVQFQPFRPGLAVEVMTLAEMRDTSPADEFEAPQRPAFDTLVHVLRGRTAHDVDFVRYSLAPGDLLWVRAGQVQQWGDIGAIDGRVLLYPPEVVDPGTTELLTRSGAWAQPLRTAGTYPADEFGTLVEVIRSLSDGPAGASRNAAAGHLLAALLLRIAGEGESVPATLGTHRAFTHLVDEHFATHRSVRSYAEMLGYTAHSLNRIVRQHGGTTAKQVIDNRVVLEAKRLLVHETAAPVAEIADRLGFTDTANFSKYFSHRTGIAPGGFRALRTRVWLTSP